MDIKLVLVDIDGTLLNDDKEVTSKTREAISKLASKGIKFGIATGRTPYGVIKLVKDWQIEEYTDLIMGFNGASTYYLKEGISKGCYLLDGRNVAKIKEDFKDFDVNMGIYDEESFHCLKEDDLVLKIAKGNKLAFYQEDLSNYYNRQIEKLLIIAPKEKVDECEKYYNEHIHTNSYRAVRSTPTLFEFLNPELSKSKGIEVICQDLGITKEEVLTFGDELNDLEMIRDCTGVAMGNANPKIKELAKYITDSNNEDGIAVFLEKYIL